MNRLLILLPPKSLPTTYAPANIKTFIDAIQSQTSQYHAILKIQVFKKHICQYIHTYNATEVIGNHYSFKWIVFLSAITFYGLYQSVDSLIGKRCFLSNKRVSPTYC
uniref:Uncharacterized protein n=1 Tax=Photinus pyralis TaxID=7054 RepID=A0A1Y1MVI1_PHOPY